METKNIIALLEKSFAGAAWYGDPVMVVLKDITPNLSHKKINDNTHSIGELVLHMVAWRTFVIKKLKGEEFEMTDELNFPKPGRWEDALSNLQQSQQDLIDAVRSFPENQLGDQVPGRKYDFYSMLHGVIQHDIYHIGQIALIKKGN